MEQLFPCQPVIFLLIVCPSLFKFYRKEIIRSSLPLIPTCQIAGLAESCPPSSSSCHRASVLPIDRDRGALHARFASTGLKLQDIKSGPVTESMSNPSCSGTGSWVCTGPDSMHYATTPAPGRCLPRPQKWGRVWQPRDTQRGTSCWSRDVQ